MTVQIVNVAAWPLTPGGGKKGVFLKNDEKGGRGGGKTRVEASQDSSSVRNDIDIADY